MESRRLDALVDRPFHGALEHGRVVLVHAENEATVDHHPQFVQPPHRRSVVAAKVLKLALGLQALGVECLESHEQATQAGIHCLLKQSRLQDRLHGTRRLPQPPHASHLVKQIRSEAAITEQVVVEEVEVASFQPLDFGESVVDRLGVESATALEKGILVAEIAEMRAPPGNDDRVRYEVE